MAGRVVVVGLGPAGADLMSLAAFSAIETAPAAFTRTTRHPAVADVAARGITLRSFDDRYEQGADLEAVYDDIASTLVREAKQHGEIVYAVPGNPAVAERSVALLQEAARRGDVVVDVVPGLSFAELAWARLGIDPMSGATVVDARALDAAELSASAKRLLIAQCDSRLELSNVKLILLEVLPPTTPVTVLHHLGLPDERVWAVPLVDLDRDVEPDHLTAFSVDARPSTDARELTRLLTLAERLRAPGGCPWDAEQTHHSLTRYLLEEAYEVVEAVEALPADAPSGRVSPAAYRALEDELGDLLYQVIFHAVLAGEAGAFTTGDVARGIHDKLVRRHPHVFGDVEAGSASAVMRNWEQIKKDEKGAESIVAGITPGLPSLLYVHKLLRKAASIGLDPGSGADARARLERAVGALRETSDEPADVERVLGEVLAAAVVLARSAGVDAESVLRGWAARFRARFEAMEALAAHRGIELASLDRSEVETVWQEVGDGV